MINYQMTRLFFFLFKYRFDRRLETIIAMWILLTALNSLTDVHPHQSLWLRSHDILLLPIDFFRLMFCLDYKLKDVTSISSQDVSFLFIIVIATSPALPIRCINASVVTLSVHGILSIHLQHHIMNASRFMVFSVFDVLYLIT